MAERSQVLIVGAGPVGLFLACLLGQQGIETRVLEKRAEDTNWSRAIGITPASLKLFAQADLLDPFMKAGLQIQEARVHSGREELGRLQFWQLPGAFPFILSHPQNLTQTHLEDRVEACSTVEIRRRSEVLRIESDQVLTAAGDFSADVIFACDGHQSLLRKQLGIPLKQHAYPLEFCMADGPDLLGHESACLWFTERGAVEAFPLPGGRRRWIVQGERDIKKTVQARSAVDPGHLDAGPWPFQPRFQLARTFSRGAFCLAGDAAHVCSPIGGQGMNCGFGDAAWLAEHIEQLLLPASRARAMHAYEQERKPAFLRCARRAALGMWLGTRMGLQHRLRRPLLSLMLNQPGLHDRLARHFSMT